LVYLNNKFDKGKNDISVLKETLEYSTGGIYSALDSSGYFDRTISSIQLTEKGKEYLTSRILPQYSTFNSLGFLMIILGLVTLFQWAEWTYYGTAIIIPWYSAILMITMGFIVRFFVLRIYHQIIKRKKRMA